MSQSPVDKPHDGQKQPEFVHYGLKPLERRISLSSALDGVPLSVRVR